MTRPSLWEPEEMMVESQWERAKPVTRVQDWTSVFVSVKQLDIFKESRQEISSRVCGDENWSKIVSLNITRA